MKEKNDMDIFLENVPAFNIWYKIILTFIYHFIIFAFVLFAFWWVTSVYFLVAIPAEFLIASGANVPLMYMLINSEKIREKYTKKYKIYPWQHLWYDYSFTSPLGCAALYTPLTLYSYYDFDFLPRIFTFESNFYINDLFPYYVSIPLGIVIVIFGILLIKPSRDKDRDMNNYLLIMRPDIKTFYTDGIYKYIRHPRYLSRIILAIGFGIFANCLLAILVALVHFIPYYIFMRIADREPARLYGDEVKIYQENVPNLIPKYGTWKKFLKYIFTRKS